jgi:hypothetical protein
MTGLDVFLIPIFLVVILMIAYVFRKKFTTASTRKYFMSALIIKLLGGLFVGFIYQFYYEGGDTYNFYHDAKIIHEAFIDNPVNGLELLFSDGSTPSIKLQEYTRRIYFDKDPSSYFVIKILAIFLLFTLGTYGAAALLFALIGFTGIWKLFQLLDSVYSQRTKYFAIAILFIPSVAFWGSGILKDTITMTGVCYMVFYFHKIFFDGSSTPKNIMFLLGAAFFIYQVKIYILLCCAPALILWLSLTLSKKIKVKAVRRLLTPLAIVVGIIAGYFMLDKVAESNKRYNLETVTATAEITARWLTYVSETQGGASYSLGDFDYSPLGMAKKFLPAVNVTLFRPYLWEVNNPVMLLSALESLAFLLLTFWAVRRRGFVNSLGLLRKNPFLVFCLLFTVVFSFAVGISTYNFGSLVRYKIPILPFYGVFLILLSGIKNRRKYFIQNLSSVTRELHLNFRASAKGSK